MAAPVLGRRRLLRRRSRLTLELDVGEEGTGPPLDSDLRGGLQRADRERADPEDETELRPSLSSSILLYGSGTTPGHRGCLLLRSCVMWTDVIHFIDFVYF